MTLTEGFAALYIMWQRVMAGPHGSLVWWALLSLALLAAASAAAQVITARRSDPLARGAAMIGTAGWSGVCVWMVI